MTARHLIVSLALVALAPAGAAAQFTTFVPPQRVDTVVVTDTVLAPTADSLSRANINNMKAWVDSAAGDAVDLAAVTTPARDTGFGPVATFRDGAPAPNTATPLPLLVALGMGAIGAGAFLLRRQ